jgi:hypothetical protein
MTPAVCGDPSAANTQTVTITSSDGDTFTVKATPGITFPYVALGSTGPTDETTLHWTGEPAFTVSKQDLRWTYYWQFKVVAPGQAEVFSQYSSLMNGVVGYFQCKGTLTRSN